MIDDATGGEDEPKRPVVSRGLGKGLGAILPSPGRAEEEPARGDELTDLPNRVVLEERFEYAHERAVREDGAALALLVVALDDFGTVNQSFGHRAGDGLLHDATGRLLATRRKSDTVARFAGDQFVIVCPYVASAAARPAQMATNILEDLRRPSSVEELSTSCRPASFFTSPLDAPGPAPSFETLLGDASLAMRRAKDTKVGGVPFSIPTMPPVRRGTFPEPPGPA